MQKFTKIYLYQVLAPEIRNLTVKCKLWFFWFFKVENTEEFVIGSSGQGNRVFGKVDWFNNVLVLQVEQFFAIDGVPNFGREIRCSTSCNQNKPSESNSGQGQKLGIRNPEIRIKNKISDQESGISFQLSVISNQKSEIRNQESGIRNQESEIRS